MSLKYTPSQRHLIANQVYFILLIIIIYYSFHRTVDSEEESYNGTESKSDSELSEPESDVEREGLQEPPNTPTNFGCKSEMESGSDIDENLTESDLNAFKDNTETSFECPMQYVDKFEPLYPGASMTRFVTFPHQFDSKLKILSCVECGMG